MNKNTIEKTPLKILYLEDSPKDAEIVRELLIEAGYDLHLDYAQNKSQFVSMLRDHNYDAVLSDFTLPGFNALGALQLCKDTCPEVPFICVSGSIGEEIAIELIKNGAVDYILKDRMVRLPSAIKRALDEVKEKNARRQAEEALKKSESRLRSYFELSIAGIAITSPTKGWIEVNDHLCEMLGYSREELQKLTWSELTHPDDLDNDVKHFNQVLKGEMDGYSIDKRFICNNGNVIWTSLSVRCVRLPDGKVDYFVALFFDITDRKNIEESIRESEEKYRSIYENSSVGILLTLPDGIILSANDYACRLFGMTEEDICQAGRDAIIDTTDPRLPVLLEERIKTGKARGELTFIRKDGTKFEGEISSIVFLDKDGKEKTSMVIQDLTERKKAEEALKLSEGFLNSVIDQSPVPIWISDDKGSLIRINKACLDLLNIKEAEVTGKYNVLKDNIVEQQELMPKVKSVYEKGETVNFEIKYDTSRLSSLSIEQKISVILDTTIFPIKNASGNITNAVIQHIDITERKLLEEQMRQMQRLEGLGTLAGGIAHDFNNILGIILAHNTIIERFKDDKEKFDLSVETVNKAVDRGRTIVQQVLTFARKSETTFGAVNVNDIVMEILTMIIETFPKTISYAQSFHKKLPFINADRSQLHQALLNLCVNARDAMPNGGLLTINTALVPGNKLLIRHPAASDVNYISIEVSDTGEGISEDVKKRIFEPFFTTKGVGKGTGLGLAVVYGVIQTHKGFIDIESEPGKGATFRLLLPAMELKEQPVQEKEEELLVEIKGGKETLLVIEDEEMLMTSLQMLLDEKGYNVLAARDGLEALKIYQDEKDNISLVLTDLGLPTMSGLEVCQRIRQIKPSERLILATGYLDPDMKTEFLNAGIKNFLFKPYDMKKVLMAIREILDGK